MFIGLDYGTTTTLAVSWQDGKIREAARLLSSVFIDKEHHYLTDEEAYKKKTAHDGLYVHSPKTLLGESKSGDVHAEELVCATLDALFRNVSLEPDEDVCITLTVPNAWRDRQYVMMRKCVFRSAEKAFGRRFNKEQFTIIPEPVAAALYFIINRTLDGTADINYVVVCDVGGGTSDLAVVKCEKFRELQNFDLRFDVVCPMEGSPGLGGDNFDMKLQNYLLPHGIPENISEHVVWTSIRALKSQLSYLEYARVPLVKEDGSPLLDYMNQLKYLDCTRGQFEALIHSDLDRLRQMLTRLAEALLQYDPYCDLSKVYLLPVGGSCRIPAIRQILYEVFKARPFELENEKAGTYDSIASGAAYYSAWLSNGIPGYRNIIIRNKLPHRLSIRYGENALETWVSKNDPDGDYCPKMLHPVRLNADGETFRIGVISIFQGEGNLVSGHENTLLFELSIDTPIHTHGRALENVPVKLVINIRSARVHEIRISVESGNADSTDFAYVKVIDQPDI